MSSSKIESQQTSWSSIMRDPAMSKLLVNLIFSGLSYGIYNNLVYFFFKHLDPIEWFRDFALYYLVFQITFSIALPLGGVLTDRIGRKPMLILGATVSALGTFVFPVATEWWHMLYASALQALGYALLGTAQNCVVADVTRGYRREKGYSITMSFGMVFGVIGTVVLIIYSAVYQSLLPADLYYKLPLLMSAILSLTAAIPMFVIRIPPPPREDDIPDHQSEGNAKSFVSAQVGRELSKQTKPPQTIWGNSVVLKMIAFQAIIGFGAGFLVPVFNYYWSDIFHLSEYVIYTIAFLGELGVALGGLAAPWLAKRVTKLGGRVGTTVSCQLLSISCAIYLAMVPYNVLLFPAVIAFIARQALMNMVSPLMSAMTMDHTPATKRGRVNSLTALAFNIPNGISPSLSRELVSSVASPPGSAYGYTYSAAVLVTTYIFGTALLSTTKKKDKLLVKQTRQM